MISTPTATEPTVDSGHAVTSQPNRLLPAVMKSEWTKLRSVRSTVWALLATIGITIGLGMLLCLAYVARYDRLDLQRRRNLDPTLLSLRGLFLSSLAIGVLGVLVMTAEYATGSIRSTFTAVPQRRTVLAAKALVFGAVALVVSFGSAFVAFGVGQAILARKHVGVSLSDPTVLRAVAGAGLYLTVVGLLGLALGTILRRTAGAIATLVGLIFIADVLVSALPDPWDTDIGKFFPGNAGLALFSVRPNADRLTPGAAAIVLVLWVAAAFTVATVALMRRDA
jgi:ABC-type transport system involved in multi-copper enzyme maturation permease subunit